MLGLRFRNRRATQSRFRYAVRKAMGENAAAARQEPAGDVKADGNTAPAAAPTHAAGGLHRLHMFDRLLSTIRVALFPAKAALRLWYIGFVCSHFVMFLILVIVYFVVPTDEFMHEWKKVIPWFMFPTPLGAFISFGSCPPQPPLLGHCKQLSIDIRPDFRPSETSWAVYDPSGLVVAEMSGAQWKYGLKTESVIACSSFVNLCANGTFTFNISDSAGNGICCNSNGYGRYYLYLNGERIHYSGSDFGYGEGVEIDVSNGPAYSYNASNSSGVPALAPFNVSTMASMDNVAA